MLVGALNAASPLGAQLLIRNCDGEDETDARQAIDGLVRSGANALLLPPPYSEIVDRAASLHELDIPMMAISPGRELGNIPEVRIDDFGSARAMTERLIERGHRRIALIGGPARHYAAAIRLAGYRAALTAAGIPIDPALEAPGDFSYESGLAAAQRLITLRRAHRNIRGK